MSLWAQLKEGFRGCSGMSEPGELDERDCRLRSMGPQQVWTLSRVKAGTEDQGDYLKELPSRRDSAEQQGLGKGQQDGNGDHQDREVVLVENGAWEGATTSFLYGLHSLNGLGKNYKRAELFQTKIYTPSTPLPRLPLWALCFGGIPHSHPTFRLSFQLLGFWFLEHFSALMASVIWASRIVSGEKVHTLANNLCPQPLTVPTPHRSTISLSYSHHHPSRAGILNRKEQLEPSKPITLELKIPSLLLEPPYQSLLQSVPFQTVLLYLANPCKLAWESYNEVPLCLSSTFGISPGYSPFCPLCFYLFISSPCFPTHVGLYLGTILGP